MRFENAHARTGFSILLNCNRKAGALFMPRFIEEFYYGNIDPQARSTKENKAVQQQMKILMNNEDLLTNTLTDNPKKWFLDYVNAWGVVNGESNLNSFIMGFRLGANFAYEAFVETKAPFEDLLKE